MRVWGVNFVLSILPFFYIWTWLEQQQHGQNEKASARREPIRHIARTVLKETMRLGPVQYASVFTILVEHHDPMEWKKERKSILLL